MLNIIAFQLCMLQIGFNLVRSKKLHFMYECLNSGTWWLKMFNLKIRIVFKSQPYTI